LSRIPNILIATEHLIHQCKDHLLVFLDELPRGVAVSRQMPLDQLDILVHSLDFRDMHDLPVLVSN